MEAFGAMVLLAAVIVSLVGAAGVFLMWQVWRFLLMIMEFVLKG